MVTTSLNGIEDAAIENGYGFAHEDAEAYYNGEMGTGYDESQQAYLVS